MDIPKLNLPYPHRKNFAEARRLLFNFKFNGGKFRFLQVVKNDRWKYWRIGSQSTESTKHIYNKIKIPYPGFVPPYVLMNIRYSKNILGTYRLMVSFCAMYV